MIFQLPVCMHCVHSKFHIVVWSDYVSDYLTLFLLPFFELRGSPEGGLTGTQYGGSP